MRKRKQGKMRVSPPYVDPLQDLYEDIVEFEDREETDDHVPLIPSAIVPSQYTPFFSAEDQ